MPYCVDRANMRITKFDCPCAPSGLDRHEFTEKSTDKDKILETAKAKTGLTDLTFCEHF